MYDLTDWFKGSVKPIYHGVYEREIEVDFNRKVLFYSYWNGNYWGHTCSTAEEASKFSYHRSSWQAALWRGCKKKYA